MCMRRKEYIWSSFAKLEIKKKQKLVACQLSLVKFQNENIFNCTQISIES